MKFRSSSASSLHKKKLQYLENFVVMHPLLQSFMKKKLLMTMNHGNNLDLFQNQKLGRESFMTFQNSKMSMKFEKDFSSNFYSKQISYRDSANYNTIIEAPFIVGNSKAINIKIKRRPIALTAVSKERRPQTSSTVIRSRSSQPSIRKKLQYYSSKHQIQVQDNLSPKLKSRQLKN